MTTHTCFFSSACFSFSAFFAAFSILSFLYTHELKAS